MNFQISALEPQPFVRLFELPADALASHLAIRCVATDKPGFPCRVSLEDAEVGDELVLINYTHQAVASPYRASHAIFVRRGVRQASLAPGEVPEALRSRVLSLRAFDKDGMLATADLCDGHHLQRLLVSQLAQRQIAYVHIHFAKFGCYAARADRS